MRHKDGLKIMLTDINLEAVKIVVSHFNSLKIKTMYLDAKEKEHGVDNNSVKAIGTYVMAEGLLKREAILFLKCGLIMDLDLKKLGRSYFQKMEKIMWIISVNLS